MGEKPIIMTQVLNPENIGGTMTVFKTLLNSSLKESFEFVPLIQNSTSLSIKEILKLRKLIKISNPDLVDVQGVNIEALPAIVAAKLAGAKVIMGVHGMYSDLYEISRLKKWISAYIIEPLAFYLSDGVYCVCEFASKRKKVTRFTRRSLGFSYNPAPDYSYYDKVTIRKFMRTELGLNEDETMGIIVSRLTYDKGLSFFTEALLKLLDKWPPDFRILIVGEGRYMKVMKDKLKILVDEGKIIFTGLQNEVHKYLFASDFCISPSLHENHSLTLLEASSAGLPILATWVGGNPEIVSDGLNGKLIPAMSSEELSRGIKYMIDNKEKFKAMGSKSREIAHSKFNIQNWIDGRKDIYLRMITD